MSPTRFFVLIVMNPNNNSPVVVHDEGLETGMDWDRIPHPSGSGMLCICGTKTMDAVARIAPDSPAPAWRRPTLDEMIAIIEGRTPPTIKAWLDAVKP